MGCSWCSWRICGSLAVAAFIAHTFYAIYQLAVPEVEYAPGMPVIEPIWPPGSNVTIEVELGTGKTRKRNPSLVILRRTLPFSTLAEPVQADRRICSSVGLALGVCDVSRLGGISVEGTDTGRPVELSAAQQAAAESVAAALQRGSPDLVAHVTATVRPPPQTHVPVAARVVSSRGGAVRLVLQRPMQRRQRKAFLLSNRSSVDEAHASERQQAIKAMGSHAIAAALAREREAAEGTMWPSFVTKVDAMLVCEERSLPVTAPPQLLQSITLVQHPSRRSHVQHEAGSFAPGLFANPVDPPSDRLSALNASFATVGMTLSVQVVPPSRLVLMHVMGGGVKRLESMLGGGEEMRRELDDVSRLVTETPAWLLALTMAVSVVHLWLDTLALHADVSFWASASSLRGVSRSVLATQAVSELVIALYLWEQGASLLVFGPAVAFAAVQVWKLVRSWSIASHEDSAAVVGPEEAQGVEPSKTEQYDSEAAGHVMAVLAPLLLGGTVYSLVWQEHGSWAQWALQTAVSAVYGLGFALMTPQVYVNYRLRSVASGAATGLLFRCAGTFIDDLFAFTIRAPLLHRISVFRDDIVFFVLLGQICMYPVDVSRKDPASGEA